MNWKTIAKYLVPVIATVGSVVGRPVLEAFSEKLVAKVTKMGNDPPPPPPGVVELMVARDRIMASPNTKVNLWEYIEQASAGWKLYLAAHGKPPGKNIKKATAVMMLDQAIGNAGPT